MRVFVAGASGAIGEPLISELLKKGHSVVGMTTSEAGANLERPGSRGLSLRTPSMLQSGGSCSRRSKAEAVIDELTSLPKEQSDMPKYAAAGDAKRRIDGGGNLFRAAIASGVRQYLRQSHEDSSFEGGRRHAGGRIIFAGRKCKPGRGGECADVRAIQGAII